MLSVGSFFGRGFDSKPLPATAGSHLALSSCPSEELPENFPLLISPRRVRFITHRNSEGLKLLSCRPNNQNLPSCKPRGRKYKQTPRQSNSKRETFHSSHSVKSRSKGVNRPPTALAQRIFLQTRDFYTINILLSASISTRGYRSIQPIRPSIDQELNL